MKKSLMIIPLVILLCFTFGCQPTVQEMTDAERTEIAKTVKQLSLECAKVFGQLELEPYMKYYLNSDIFTFVMNGQTTRSYSSFYDQVKSSLSNFQEADVAFTDVYVDVYSREHAIVHGPFKWSATYNDGKQEEVSGHIVFVYILDKGEWKIAFASEYFPSENQMP